MGHRYLDLDYRQPLSLLVLPNYFLSGIVSEEIRDRMNEMINLLREKGATVDFIDIDYIENAVTLYQIIAMGEASSNLARFDGVRFGYSTENPKSVEDLYRKTRAEGFGKEVKRRILFQYKKQVDTFLPPRKNFR